MMNLGALMNLFAVGGINTSLSNVIIMIMKYWLHFDNLEQIEEFVVFMGAYEITSLLKDIDDAPYKSEIFVILGYCLEYYNDNPYITEFLERT